MSDSSLVVWTHNDRNDRNDTQVDSVLVSNDSIYWDGSGMMLPILRGETVCHNTEGHPFNFSEEVVEDLMHWVRSSNNYGYCGTPLEWE